MIYIHRDWSQVPDEIKEALKKAADVLETIEDPEARKAYIKANSNAWTAVRSYLAAMSAQKCWYSEAKESVSRYQVDHFRPHGRAKQEDRTYEDGYSWLAFELDNFRLAGMLCNTVNKEYSEESVGKGDWFPLLNPVHRATLQNRCFGSETPVLLDPTEKEDPAKLWFNDDGEVLPSPELEPEMQKVVSKAIRYLGISQSLLNERRRSMLRRVARIIARYKAVAKIPKGDRSDNDRQNIEVATAELLAMSSPSGEFTAAVRCYLIANGLRHLVVQDELKAMALEEA
nr:hypothetical protein [uncultured Comamonas sp.]